MNILRLRSVLIVLFVCFLSKNCEGKAFDFSCLVSSRQNLSYLSLDDAQVARTILIGDLADLNAMIRDPKGPCGGSLEPKHRYNTRYQARFAQARALYKKYHSVLTNQLANVEEHIESLMRVVDEPHQEPVPEEPMQNLQQEHILIQRDVQNQLPVDNVILPPALAEVQQQEKLVEPAHQQEDHEIENQRGCLQALRRGLGAMKGCFSRFVSRLGSKNNQ